MRLVWVSNPFGRIVDFNVPYRADRQSDCRAKSTNQNGALPLVTVIAAMIQVAKDTADSGVDCRECQRANLFVSSTDGSVWKAASCSGILSFWKQLVLNEPNAQISCSDVWYPSVWITPSVFIKPSSFPVIRKCASQCWMHSQQRWRFRYVFRRGIATLNGAHRIVDYSHRALQRVWQNWIMW